MTTDSNKDNNVSANENSIQLNSSTSRHSSFMSGSSMAAAPKTIASQNFGEQAMTMSNSSHSVSLDTNNVGTVSPFSRLQLGQVVPMSSTSPSMSTTPPVVSSSASSAFKIVPQRQKHLHDNNEGKVYKLIMVIVHYVLNI